MKTNNENSQLVQKQIKSKIINIRGQKVILDTDLAQLYGTTTKVLNQAVKRNIDRFPEDFAFRLTTKEKNEVVTNCDHLNLLKFSYVNPFAFTEHGAIMAANILNSKDAVQMSVFIVRAFIKMREQLAITKEMAKRLAEIEKTLIVHDSALVDLYNKIRPLLLPPKTPPKPPIGFKDKKVKYNK